MNTPPPYLQERYRLVEWLGKGGTAVVYRAYDEVLQRDVAIKFLAPTTLADETRRKRFLREARATARLVHPHIMTIYDVGQESGWLYLALELIPGQTLRLMLDRQPGALPIPTARQIVQHILAALAYAHARGIIHRDIKPENVMVTPDGQSKVMDFGLALPQDEARLTREGAIMGTILYLAPELLQGQPATTQTDLYAIGVVFFELLTGRPPFADQSAPGVMLPHILQTPPPPPSLANPRVPAALDELVLALLAKEPALRPASAAATLALLARQAEQPIVLRAGSSPLLPELIAHTAAAETAVARENERRHLAQRLHSQIMEPLHMLLAQAGTYEQILAANPTARMAVSVLTALARQVLQQARDLEADLHPALLDTLGLEAALETLANRMRRIYGVQIDLDVVRLRERPPAKIELALFRAAQEVAQRAVQQRRATHLTIRLASAGEQIALHIADNGDTPLTAVLPDTQTHILHLGGDVNSQANTGQGATHTIQFHLTPPVQLTPRELELLQLLAQGMSNKEMAQALAVSPRTINFHLDNIYSKLGVSSRTEAAVYALRRQLVE